jgi:hypothetical protein
VARRVVVALAVGLAALVAAPLAGTGTADDLTGGVTAADQGWWSALSGVGTQPGSPIAGVVPAQKAPAPDVPDGVLPVSVRAGQVDRVSGLGISIDAPVGSTVRKLVLHLKEAPSASQGVGAAVVACTIDDYVQADTNGYSYNTPADDCQTAHADGARASDGTWTFDLSALASSWQLDGSGSLHWIRLDPKGAAPATFQVGFTGKQDATFDADIVPGSGDLNGGFGSFGSDSAFGSSFGGSDSAFSTPASPAPATPDVPSANGAKRTPPTVPAVATGTGHTFGDSALGTMLLIVGLLALALAAAWTMGSNGRTDAEVVRRSGGVRRALGARTGTGELHG